MWIFCPAAQTNHTHASKPVSSLTTCDKNVIYTNICVRIKYIPHTRQRFTVFIQTETFIEYLELKTLLKHTVDTVHPLYSSYSHCCDLETVQVGATWWQKYIHTYFWTYILKDVLGLTLYSLCVKLGSVKTSFLTHCYLFFTTFSLWFQSIFDIVCEKTNLKHPWNQWIVLLWKQTFVNTTGYSLRCSDKTGCFNPKTWCFPQADQVVFVPKP